jgi:hypothetical protein
MAKEHSMATIEREQQRPMTKQTPGTIGKDAKVHALTIVSTMFAAVQSQAAFWHGMVWNIIDATTDCRVEIIRLIDEKLTAMRDENRQAHGKAEKNRENMRWERANVGSYTAMVSCMRTIAKAFNAGAHEDGLAEFLGVSDPRNAGYMQVVAYARTFNDAEGRGRKADSFKVALKKFLEKRAESLATDTDKVNHQRAMQFLDNLQD